MRDGAAAAGAGGAAAPAAAAGAAACRRFATGWNTGTVLAAKPVPQPRCLPARPLAPARRCVLNVCQAGNELLCAGYTLYSSATILVLTVGARAGDGGEGEGGLAACGAAGSAADACTARRAVLLPCEGRLLFSLTPSALPRCLAATRLLCSRQAGRA